MITAENLKPYMPLIYLVITAAIAVGCHLLKVPEGVTGLLIGAGLTRVKVSK